MAGQPIFVKIDEHEDIKDMIKLVKNKIEESKQTISVIKQLEQQEAAELEAWAEEIDDVEKKVAYVESTLYEQVQ